MTISWRSTKLAGLGVLLTTAPWLATPSAQRNQPVYPAYDGYVANADGSYTLAFGYFSHNAETVSVPPGSANGFSPSPGDRQQPVTFHPGHHRFQCVMVVGPDFDGNLRWTLGFAGTTTGTSERMLQSNWNLVEGAADLRRIDFAKAPKGVCLNRAPAVRILGLRAGARGAPPTLTTAIDERLPLFGSVEDEGLPRNAPLVVTWRQIDGPGVTTFENANVARTRARFSTPGSYLLEISATDSELADNFRVSVLVK